MLSELDIKIIRCLQEDLPLVPQPYAVMAQELQIPESVLLERIELLKSEKIIRRYGATVNHRHIGFSANAMVVWRVSADVAVETGKAMATFKEVSHCYQRPLYESWPYNLYTMIHGSSREDCEAVVEKISEATGQRVYRILYSSKELKKSSMRYFMENESED